MDWLRPEWYYFGSDKIAESNASQACEPVQRNATVRPDGRDR